MPLKWCKCVFVGISSADVRAPINVNQPIYVEKSLIGSPSGTTLSQQDLQVLMDMPASGKRMLGELFARRYRRSQISEAYDAPQGGAGIDC